MSMAFTTRLAAGAIDLVICPRSDFTEQAEHGMFRDLSEFLPADMYEKLSDRLLSASLVEYDEAGEIVSHSEPVMLGIDLSGSDIYKEYGSLAEQPVLCVAGNIQNTENALQVISRFTGIE